MLKNILAGVGVVMLVAFVILASPALGADPAVLAPNSTLNTDVWPPVRFQGDTAVRAMFVHPRLINDLCGTAPAGFVTEACSQGNIVILPNPCLADRTDEYARLVCHEIAHTNLWPASHGDAMRRV